MTGDDAGRVLIAVARDRSETDQDRIEAISPDRAW
jgi:hypothetical protein